VKRAKAGEFWSINDSRTRGHKSLITKSQKNGKINHIPITHAPKTRNMKNIPLKENPQRGNKTQAYAIPKKQTTKAKFLGKKQNDMRIKNKTDKSIFRKIKKTK